MFRFLLASLNIEVILGEVTISQRRKKLGETAHGSGLSGAYAATLTRLKAQKGNWAALGRKALMWVLYSERPLRADELCHALGVEIGSADLDPENIPALRTLLSSCLGLLKFEGSSSIVRPVHFTLKEHLSSDPTLFHSSHSAIAGVCLTYLNFRSVRNLSPTLNSAPSTMPLLEYASFYCGVHITRGMTENVKLLALEFLEVFHEHISIRLVHLNENEGRGYWPHCDSGRGLTRFLGLSRVAIQGGADAIAAVLEAKEGDVNPGRCMESETLVSEASRRQEAVAKMLSRRGGATPYHADSEDGEMPLLWAAMMGHEGVVKTLLERENVDPNQTRGGDGRTPLWWAAMMGREGVVRILLEQGGVNPNSADAKYGVTPLSVGAERGHEEVVRMLLQRQDVNPDHTDTEYGQTPLSLAAAKGHEGVVQMLLQRQDVNPDHIDIEYGQTPLSWAAKNGNEGVVKILLEREDVNPNHADTIYGRTPLSWAAKKGNEGVVKILLEREDVNPNHADTIYGRTPLSCAAERGYESVVKMLLERNDIVIAVLDNNGQNPISLALSGGHDGVARILQERDDVGSDEANHCDQASVSSSTPPIAVNWYWVIGFCVCLLAFLAYSKNSSN